MKHGADEFVSFVNDWGNPSWSTIAIEQQLEAIIPAYHSFYPAKQIVENVKSRLATDADNEIASVESAVQLAESSWTIIYQVIALPLDEEEIRRGMADAERLSETLNTRALAFSGEDTSGAMGFELYQGGKLVSSHEWESQTDTTEKQFKKFGLSVPVCYPVSNEEIVAQRMSVKIIERCVCFV